MKAVFQRISDELMARGFVVVRQDLERPWGGFFAIDEGQAQLFADNYFDSLDVEGVRLQGKLSPKILIINPGCRLSWQYHNRRSELWQVHSGKVNVVRSHDDLERDVVELNVGDRISLSQGERHRLVGLTEHAVVAEIWQHTCNEPSDEDDIIRVSDDYNRTK